jgi:hypothetical protein
MVAMPRSYPQQGMYQPAASNFQPALCGSLRAIAASLLAPEARPGGQLH